MKKQKKKGKVRTVKEKVDSFFHFFTPPEFPSEEEAVNMDEEAMEAFQEEMEDDYETGNKPL